MRRKESNIKDTLTMNNEEFKALCFDDHCMDEMIELFEICPIYFDDKPIGVVLDVTYGDTDELTDVEVFIFDEYAKDYMGCSTFEFVMLESSYDFLSIG